MHVPSEILKKKVIAILDQIDHFLDYVILYENTGTVIKEDELYKLRPTSGISFAGLDEADDIYLVEKYLQSEGIEFDIDFDFTNETPSGVVTADDKLDDNAVFGSLRGKPLDIKGKIQNLKNNLLGLQGHPSVKSNSSTLLGLEIKSLEVLEDKTEIKKVTVYVNEDYEKTKSFSRGKNWEAIYNLAKDGEIPYNKDIFDYFNSNQTNPLYSKGEFKVTKILKSEDNTIYPNIKIEITTENKVTRRRKAT